MCEVRFYVCEICGNLVGMIESSGAPLVCCGQEMTHLEPNTVDASAEKHVPMVTLDGNTLNVQVGSVLHPATKEHHISWIYVQTKSGGQRKCIEPGDDPKASFNVEHDAPLAVFAYCNLHGLWMTEL